MNIVPLNYRAGYAIRLTRVTCRSATYWNIDRKHNVSNYKYISSPAIHPLHSISYLSSCSKSVKYVDSAHGRSIMPQEDNTHIYIYIHCFSSSSV